MNVHFLDYIVAFELNRTIIEGKKTITRSRFITLQPSWSLILFCPWLGRKIFPWKGRNLISCLKVWAGPAYDLYLWPKCLSNEIPKGTNLFFFFFKSWLFLTPMGQTFTPKRYESRWGCRFVSILETFQSNVDLLIYCLNFVLHYNYVQPIM